MQWQEVHYIYYECRIAYSNSPMAGLNVQSRQTRIPADHEITWYRIMTYCRYIYIVYEQPSLTVYDSFNARQYNRVDRVGIVSWNSRNEHYYYYYIIFMSRKRRWIPAKCDVLPLHGTRDKPFTIFGWV